MKENFGMVSLFIDPENTIYAVPFGWDRITQAAVNAAGIDLLFILKSPYSADEAEAFLLNALEHCFTKEREPGLGPLEKHFGVKSWNRAVKNLKYVFFLWNQKNGYKFTPSVQTKRQGHSPLEESSVYVDDPFQKGQLADALYNAIKASTRI